MKRLFGSAQILIRTTAVLAVVALVALGVAAGPRLVGAQDATGFVASDTLVVNTDALNFRADAALDAEVIAVLATGAAVSVVDGPISADGYSWYQVETDAGTGYIAGEFLGTDVTVSTSIGFAIGDELVVNTDVLNLRADATVDGEILAELVTGDSATVVDGPIAADEYIWYQVETAAGTGWVAGDYLGSVETVASTAGYAIGDVTFVDTDVLNLRSEATADGEVLAQLETGATATILNGPVSADGYTWYQVETDAGSGWFAGEYLSLA